MSERMQLTWTEPLGAAGYVTLSVDAVLDELAERERVLLVTLIGMFRLHAEQRLGVSR